MVAKNWRCHQIVTHHVILIRLEVLMRNNCCATIIVCKVQLQFECTFATSLISFSFNSWIRLQVLLFAIFKSKRCHLWPRWRFFLCMKHKNVDLLEITDSFHFFIFVWWSFLWLMMHYSEVYSLEPWILVKRNQSMHRLELTYSMEFGTYTEIIAYTNFIDFGMSQIIVPLRLLKKTRIRLHHLQFTSNEF